MEKKHDKPRRLLFVCLGNICRSPAAEAVMQHLVQQTSQANQFFIDSAGIGSWHVGELPDKRMRKHGAARGYDLSSRARQFVEQDFERFDAIYVMDNDNYRNLTARARTDAEREKVHLLAHFLEKHLQEHVIPDPYYGGASGFDYVLDLVEDACSSLLAKIL